MTLDDIVASASRKANFITLQEYIDFCCRYLDFVAQPTENGDADHLQARIVCQNENSYRFY